jgi:hypothetical protein
VRVLQLQLLILFLPPSVPSWQFLKSNWNLLCSFMLYSKGLAAKVRTSPTV